MDTHRVIHNVFWNVSLTEANHSFFGQGLINVSLNNTVEQSGNKHWTRAVSRPTIIHLDHQSFDKVASNLHWGCSFYGSKECNRNKKPHPLQMANITRHTSIPYFRWTCPSDIEEVGSFRSYILFNMNFWKTYPNGAANSRSPRSLCLP